MLTTGKHGVILTQKYAKFGEGFDQNWPSNMLIFRETFIGASGGLHRCLCRSFHPRRSCHRLTLRIDADRKLTRSVFSQDWSWWTRSALHDGWETGRYISHHASRRPRPRRHLKARPQGLCGESSKRSSFTRLITSITEISCTNYSLRLCFQITISSYIVL